MFSRQPKEGDKTENNEIQDILKKTVDNPTETETENHELENKPEVVNVVEKISGIVSPYFIVLVGLILSDDNFLFGTLLIFIGILSLLKVTTKDVNKLINWLKNLFSS
jgi:hypothetical protein